ncbi:site-specific DNA-methyltransferase [Bacillus sp. 2205SS5-2]|uniref:site-specific DNA-methyltransferase n=1 Tax=Bacillus sp. 2205SS5-2 TaxID=3109031 RepID=UPI00300419EC
MLSDIPEYWEEDTLLKNKVIEDLRNYKLELVEPLLTNDVIKETYSVRVSNNYIFKIDEFISMLRYKNYLENSYTKYSNEIGLTTEGKYLKYNSDIVIDFPHKDCILEGGMTNEDTKRSEIYLHSILAKEEIDTLLSPKVMTNIKKYNKYGIEDINEFDEGENLILKGNNLIGLHSLKSRYAGEVKQIFIDPPYYFIEKKKDDTFGYNSNFKLSTWLTFMKNRLEVAKDLLSEDGSIWISIDDDGSHYLKVLCDGIFGSNNFVGNVIWEKKFSPQNDATWLSDSHDHILVYAKNKEIWRPNLLPRSEEMNSRYTNSDNDPRGPWTSGDLSVKTYSANTDYTITTPSGREVNPPPGYCWRVTKEKLEEMINDKRIWFGKDGNNVPRIKRFLSEVKDGVTAMTIWKHSEVGHNQDAKREVNALDDVETFSTPKPEKLLQRVIHLGSNEGDIVLDFFMGSATTQAVAMKMQRRFIGIEQMDYIESVSVPRLQKVIAGEQGGISKDLNWQGGGSFVYAEMLPLNQHFVKRIQGTETDTQLERVILEMFHSAFFDYRVNLDKLTNEESGFHALTFEEKKKVLIKSLDANQMYLGYSEMEDDQYVFSIADKKFNRMFYTGKNLVVKNNEQ